MTFAIGIMHLITANGTAFIVQVLDVITYRVVLSNHLFLICDAARLLSLDLLAPLSCFFSETILWTMGCICQIKLLQLRYSASFQALIVFLLAGFCVVD